MTIDRQLHFNVFLSGVGHHEAAWRLPGVDPLNHLKPAYFQHVAQVAERGLLDAVFFADTPSLPYWDGTARRPSERIEPSLLAAVMATATERVGLIATGSTTFEEPWNLARRFASLDIVSGGRVGWNIVTSGEEAAARNFGSGEMPSHSWRYERGDEFVRVVHGLWSSWRDDVVVADKETGVYAEPSRIRRLDHVGEHFQVAGPLNVGRSPQGWPVMVQAGSSKPGVALAAKYAEVIFTAQNEPAAARAFYAELKAAVAAAGRDPERVAVLPGLMPVIGSTEEEARELQRRLDALVVLDHGLEQLSHQTGLPVDRLDPDAPLPEDVRPPEEFEGNRSRYELTLELARREGLTVRELIVRLGAGRGHRLVIGTPEQVADEIEEWLSTRAADGFNLLPPVLPDSLETFVDEVVPLLQGRGLFRKEYAGATLRSHYGLDVPPSADATVGP